MRTLGAAVALCMVATITLGACGADDPADGTSRTGANIIKGEGGGGGSGEGEGCTLTQGYWKNHPSAWPTDALTIGGVTYTKAELLALFKTPPKGDASLILGHQLIASMLNVASGAGSPPAVASALAEADAWMAANKDADGKLPYKVKSGAARDQAVALSATLDGFNQGNTGPGHCDDGPGSGGASGSTGSGGTDGSSSSSGSGGGEMCGPEITPCGPGLPACPVGSSCISGCCGVLPE